MKRLIIIIFTLFLGTMYLSAQEKGFTCGAFGSLSGKRGEFIPIDLEIDLGYNFNSSISLLGRLETNISLITQDSRSRYFISPTLGALAKYNFYKFKGGILDVRAGSGINITRKDWKYVYYDGGFFFQATRDLTKPTVGVGFRYYHSLAEGFKNRPLIYVSLGFTVN